MDRVIVRDLWVSGSRGGRTGVIYERNIWSNRWGNRVVTTSLIPLTFLVWDITAPGDRPDTYYVITDLPTPFWWRRAQHVGFVLDLLMFRCNGWDGRQDYTLFSTKWVTGEKCAGPHDFIQSAFGFLPWMI